MKKIVIAAVLASTSVSAIAGKDGDVGVGVILAEPTGLSAKLWLDEDEAIDLAAAWSISGTESFQLHADWLIHRYDLIDTDPEQGRAPLYYGVGARFKAHEDNGRGNGDEDATLGVRVPVGVAFEFAQVPFDVFGEVAPVLDVIPDTDIDLSIAIGGRFWFGRRDQLLPRD